MSSLDSLFVEMLEKKIENMERRFKNLHLRVGVNSLLNLENKTALTTLMNIYKLKKFDFKIKSVTINSKIRNQKMFRVINFEEYKYFKIKKEDL